MVERTLLLGIDSAEISFIESHLGSLPALRGLLARSRLARLASPAEVLSASVWPTFYTATSPGEHGQYYPMQWDPARMRLRRVATDWLGCEPFWRPLARDGLRVTTLDVQTLPASPTRDGTEIVNWGSQSFSSFHCNQPDVEREIRRRFGRHPMGPDVPTDKSARRLDAMRRRLVGGARRRGALARWLATSAPWDLLFVVFPECHRAGHYFWPTGDAAAARDGASVLLEVHRAVDAEVGALVDLVGEEVTVVVFSLHGMGSNHTQMHFVPELVDRVNAEFARREGVAKARGGNALRWLREHVPGELQERLAMAVPERARDWVTSRAFAGPNDWDRTPALALPTGSEGFVRLNLAGREARGCIAPGSARHRRYLDLLGEALLGLRDADSGRALVRDVALPQQRYPGPSEALLPDVAALWEPLPPARSATSDGFGRIEARLGTGRPGNHRPFGFVAVAGPARAAAEVARPDDVVALGRFVRDRLRAALSARS